MRTLLDLPPLPPALAKDPILVKAKEALVRAYGGRLAGAILYGSRARGDHGPESDVDILVMLKGPIDFEIERSRLAELSTDLFIETNESPSFLVMDEHALERRTGFMHNVRLDGLRL